MNRTVAVLLALTLFLAGCAHPAPAASSAPESAAFAASSAPPEPEEPETGSGAGGAEPGAASSAPAAEDDVDVLPSGIRDLTYAQALADPDFGGCVPQEPEGFAVREAHRGRSSLFISFEQAVGSTDYRELVLSASRTEPGDEGLTVDVDAVESYDVHLYEIPWADSVPAEYMETFSHPLFRAEDLSPQVLARRVYDHREPGDDHVAADFSVLCEGGVTIRVMARNIDALALFGLLESLPAVTAGQQADG